MQRAPYLLIDISNSFTKLVRADGAQLGSVRRLPTHALTPSALRKAAGTLDGLVGVVVASVVPKRTSVVRRAFPGRVLELSAAVDCGIEIDYPSPEKIGADRLANAIAAIRLYPGPAIVIDFGTAVTFDVLSGKGAYLGGVIAPGLNAMTSYLHEKTALLPRVTLREPERTVGKSTEEAMLSGAVFGYRGLIHEIVRRICDEVFEGKECRILATGGDAELIAAGLPLFDVVDPLLTLRGLQLFAERHFSPIAHAHAIRLDFQNMQRALRINLRTLERAARRALPGVLRATPQKKPRDLPEEISFVILSDAAIAEVHGRFLGDPSPTDVITFPYGEILLGAETIAENAKRFGTSFEEELLRCVVHGLLHLRGFEDVALSDHAAMHHCQEEILHELRESQFVENPLPSRRKGT
jgi:type III pantothenate kinase